MGGVSFVQRTQYISQKERHRSSVVYSIARLHCMIVPNFILKYEKQTIAYKKQSNSESKKLVLPHRIETNKKFVSYKIFNSQNSVTA